MGKKKPAGRPKATVVEVLKIEDLSQEWDSHHQIRTRLRDGEGLLSDEKGESETIPSAVANHAVLQPFLVRMSLTQTRPLPAVEDLRSEIEKCYLQNKRGQNPEDRPNVVSIAWRIRKLLGFVKMKVRRREVSSAPFRHET